MKQLYKLFVTLLGVIAVATFSIIQFYEGINELNTVKILGYTLGGIIYISLISFLSFHIIKLIKDVKKS